MTPPARYGVSPFYSFVTVPPQPTPTPSLRLRWLARIILSQVVKRRAELEPVKRETSS
jgi:hypothetical protein